VPDHIGMIADVASSQRGWINPRRPPFIWDRLGDEAHNPLL
jgi:hypothetical protein